MKKNRVQAVLPDGVIEDFRNEAKKQGRPESNLARKYIIEGIAKDKTETKNK